LTSSVGPLVLFLNEEPYMKNHRPNSTLDRLFRSAASKPHGTDYENGQVIFRQGDNANAMFRVESGHVKLAVASDCSERTATFILQAGECFGEGCLISDSLRPCTATSIQQSSVERVSKRTALRRIHDNPALSKSFVAYLVLRISQHQDDIVDQLTNSSERRLARLLLQLTSNEQPTGSLAAMNIDQGTLAEVVGTTRSRVSHFMNSFRRRGFIRYNGGLKVNRSLHAFLREKRN
jgi:CRP/FNR family transcriptional regulator, cyclic AMP receptor protein